MIRRQRNAPKNDSTFYPGISVLSLTYGQMMTESQFAFSIALNPRP